MRVHLQFLIAFVLLSVAIGSVVRVSGGIERSKRQVDQVVSKAEFGGNATSSGENSNTSGEGTETHTSNGANLEVNLGASGGGSGSSQANTGGTGVIDGSDGTSTEAESVGTVEALGNDNAQTTSDSKNKFALDWLLGRVLELRNKGYSVGTGQTTVLSGFNTRLSKTGETDLRTNGTSSAAATGSISSISSGENNVTADGEKQEAISLATARGEGVDSAKATGVATVNVEDADGFRSVVGNSAVDGSQTGTSGNSGVLSEAGGYAKSNENGEAGAATGEGVVTNDENGEAALDNKGTASDGKKTITTLLNALSNGGVGGAELKSSSNAAIDQTGILGQTRQIGRVVGTNQDLDITANVKSTDDQVGTTEGDALSRIGARGNLETIVNSTVNNNYIHPGQSEIDVFSLGQARANSGQASLNFDGEATIEGPNADDSASGVHNLSGDASGNTAFVEADADLRAKTGTPLVSLQGVSAEANGSLDTYANTAAQTLLTDLPDQQVEISAFGRAKGDGDTSNVRSDTRVDSDGSGLDIAVNDQKATSSGAGMSSISIGGGSIFNRRKKRSVELEHKKGKICFAGRCFFSAQSVDGNDHIMTLEDMKRMYGFELATVAEKNGAMTFQPLTDLENILVYAKEQKRNPKSKVTYSVIL